MFTVVAAMFSVSLRDFESLLDDQDPYPYYAILLYPPLNGLNSRLHEYVTSHWAYLNAMTGSNCLLVAVESRGQPIEKFSPEDVYAIARQLGVAVDRLPCLVFITEPHERDEVLVACTG